MKKIAYPATTTFAPETSMKELRVTTTAQTDTLTPTTGKKIRVLGFCSSQYVKTNLTSTVRASLSFGTGAVSDDTKVLISYDLITAGDYAEDSMVPINVVGTVNEVVTLTNVTFTVGTVVTQVTLYYIEE